MSIEVVVKDKSLLLFGALNLLQGGVIGAIPLIVESREPAANWLLGAVAVLMIAAGPALVFGGRVGRIIATSACLVHGIAGTILAALVLGSASYLYGIYGHHGHSAGAIAFVLAAVMLLVFWLVPAHELHFLRKQGQTR